MLKIDLTASLSGIPASNPSTRRDALITGKSEQYTTVNKPNLLNAVESFHFLFVSDSHKYPLTIILNHIQAFKSFFFVMSL